MYELPVDGNDVPSHVGIVKDYADVFCHICICLNL